MLEPAAGAAQEADEAVEAEVEQVTAVTVMSQSQEQHVAGSCGGRADERAAYTWLPPLYRMSALAKRKAESSTAMVGRAEGVALHLSKRSSTGYKA